MYYYWQRRLREAACERMHLSEGGSNRRANVCGSKAGGGSSECSSYGHSATGGTAGRGIGSEDHGRQRLPGGETGGGVRGAIVGAVTGAIVGATAGSAAQKSDDDSPGESPNVVSTGSLSGFLYAALDVGEGVFSVEYYSNHYQDFSLMAYEILKKRGLVNPDGSVDYKCDAYRENYSVCGSYNFQVKCDVTHVEDYLCKEHANCTIMQDQVAIFLQCTRRLGMGKCGVNPEPYDVYFDTLYHSGTEEIIRRYSSVQLIR